MKNTDIALLIIVVIISAGLSYWIASATIGKTNDKPIPVRTIKPIDVNDVTVDKQVFNEDAVNPTVESVISGSDLTSFIDGDEDAPNPEDNDNETDDSGINNSDNDDSGPSNTNSEDSSKDDEG